jgi:hypothetical protein
MRRQSCGGATAPKCKPLDPVGSRLRHAILLNPAFGRDDVQVRLDPGLPEFFKRTDVSAAVQSEDPASERRRQGVCRDTVLNGARMALQEHRTRTRGQLPGVREVR